MTITSLPEDGEPIIERQQDIGGEVFVATNRLIQFHEDLVAKTALNTSVQSGASVLAGTLSKISLNKKNIQLVLKRIVTLESQVAVLESQVTALQTQVTDHENRIKNMEHTAWR